MNRTHVCTDCGRDWSCPDCQHEAYQSVVRCGDCKKKFQDPNKIDRGEQR